ncbi:hypothetical protein [Chryseobacterium sp. CCH4-E10]|jgi:hypothetical protein|uniref:hypothetical protein n=1 Tax=Chryseobacterium sp. CCH4-E10 TaxID=1768758 RepID=UPI00082AFB58|nr:hypothetical protein [Chryseobacterium sp. CCH4-E10]
MKKAKIFIPTLLFLFILSCSANERPQFHYRSDRTKKYNDQYFYSKRFRDNIFYKCLQYGYGDSLNFKIGKLMAEKDLFSPYDEPFMAREESIQDSLAKRVISNMPIPYIHLEDETIEGKNFIISSCLSYYESNELNIIVKKLYKQKVKEDKKLWGKDYK